MAGKKLTPEEAAAMKDGNKPVNPNQGNQNQAFRRLLAALMGEERRWQPKGTPSKSHLLGRAFRDIALPWLANEINYHIEDRKDLEAQKKRDFPNKLREEVYLQAENPVDPTRITNQQTRNELLGTVPSPQTETSEYTRNALYQGLSGTVPENSYFPNPNMDYGAALETDAKRNLQNALNGGATNYGYNRDEILPIPEDFTRRTPTVPFGDAVMPQPLDLLGAIDALKNVPTEDPLLEELKRRGYRQWGER